MKREELIHAIRASARLVELDRVIVIGSQSVLGTWSEDELPEAATLSQEVDIMPRPISLSPADTRRLADKLGALGEMSQFDQTNGYYVDGVDETTAVLPTGWEERLVSVNAYDALRDVDVQGLCLDPHDLCIAKLIAHRSKDRVFVNALLEAELVRSDILIERLTMTVHPQGLDLDYAYTWLIDRSPDGTRGKS